MTITQNTNVMEDYELLPDPERIVNGLRDTGYNFNTAIADIIDNSIAANANMVSINVMLEPDMKTKVYITDNGIGMNEQGLKNAMRYGSKARAEKKCLGKFGLGLKTASTAFCRKLSVISRSEEDSQIRKVQWDLDYIGSKGAWLLQFPPLDIDETREFEDITNGGHGTLVVWDNIDRLMKDYKTYKNAQKGLQNILDKLRFHLSMVFQRFLDKNDSRANNVDIFVNTVKVEPWDPFCVSEPKTILLQDENVPVEMPDEAKASFHIAAYIVPRKGDFTTIQAEKNAQISNDMQGIYVYRENRLIHTGDWFGFQKKEPHYSLLRVEFSFGYDMDELLNVDIKKSRILLIGELADFIIKFLGAPFREANKIYRNKETQTLHVTGTEAHQSSNQNINSKAHEVEDAKVTQNGENTAQIENKHGVFTKTITIQHSTVPDQNRVIPVPSIDGNSLWEPALVDGKHAVNINESHPFYKKVYGPYLAQNVVVQGLDDLLWALAEAENSTCNQSSIENYEEMRFAVSRILKKLVADLPDPDIETGQGL